MKEEVKCEKRCPNNHALLGCWDSWVNKADGTPLFRAISWICPECKRTYDDCEINQKRKINVEFEEKNS